MNKLLTVLSLTFLFCLASGAKAQTNQTYQNGAQSAPINFPGTGCVYNWVNTNPGIGLATSGTGDIPSFTAVNNGGSPQAATIVATPAISGLAYVANANSQTVSVIDIATNTVVNTISFLGFVPASASVSPDGRFVYVTDRTTSQVKVISTANNAILATLPINFNPAGFIFTADSKTVYISNSGSNFVTVLDVASNSIITTIVVGSGPQEGVLSPDGSLLYVPNFLSNTVSVISTATNTVVKTIPAGFNPISIAISADGVYIYVTNYYAYTVSAINTLTNVTTVIPVGFEPSGITISPNGSLIYVVNQAQYAFEIIDQKTNTLVATVPIASAASGIAFSPDGMQFYVSFWNNNVVAVYNAANNTLINSIATGSGSVLVPNSISPVCSGSPITYNITVNATSVTPLITAGAATGIISACVGSPSASPEIQQFSVSGSNLSSGIVAAAPPGFEVSLNANSGYSNSVSLTQTGGAVNNTLVYVRSAASALGGISGNVVLSSAGAASQNITVTGIVNPLPTVTPISNQIVTAGNNTAPVNFSGNANTFTWVNDTPGIGLPASGLGNIPLFTATNTGSNPVTATITVTPIATDYLYVTSAFNASVEVVNTTTNTIVTSIPTGRYPSSAAVSPDGTKVYVSNTNPGGPGSISVINTSTNTVVATIPVGAQPSGIVTSPDGKWVYVVNTSSNSVSVINTTSNTVSTTISNIPGALYIAISPDGSRVYVTDEYNNGSINTGDVVVINTLTNTVLTTIPIGWEPWTLAVSPDGSRLYVTNTGSNNVAVINTLTNAVIATIPSVNSPDAIVVSPDGSRVYISSQYNTTNTITVIDAATNTIIATIPGINPGALSISRDGTKLYVINSNSVTVFDAQTNTLISTLNTFLIGNLQTSGNFLMPGAGCAGVPATFNITVNPTSVTPLITAGNATGTISACVGSPSASPELQQVSVSGSNLSADIVATAPPGFEVSLIATGGYSNSVTLTQTGGTINNTLVYVRSAASASGSISGNVLISSAGAASQNIAVTGIVNPLPTVNQVANQIVAAGNNTAPVNFSGNANTFTWVNDTPGIGLPASGSGNVPSFNAINTGAVPVTATITVTPTSTDYVYAVDSPNNLVKVINTATNSIVASVPVGSYPLYILVSPDRTKVYVSNSNPSGVGSVSVISTATNTLVATIPVAIAPFGMVTSPDGKWLYVVNAESFSVSVVNTATNVVLTNIPTVTQPISVAVSPDGTRIYVTSDYSNNNVFSGDVIVINALTNTVLTTIPIGWNPYTLAVSPDGTRLYVTNIAHNDVDVINTATNSVIATIPAVNSPAGIVFSPDGSRIYIANQFNNTISVIDAASNTIIATMPDGQNLNPGGLSISSDGKDLYVNNSNSNSITEFDTQTYTAINTFSFSLTGGPQALGNFLLSGTGCPGVPATFNITVNPAPPTIITSIATGSISACMGSASANPDIQQITVSGNNLINDITATAPAGFEISLNPNSGYGNSVTLIQTGSNVANTIVYVRSAATDPSGSISGNVVLSSPGAISQTVAVTGTVNAIPTVTQVGNQMVLNGASTTPVNFGGTANTYNWVNDSPGIGLPASGSGNIPSFTAINASTSAVTATVTVTPTSGCTGIPITFTITVNASLPTIITSVATGSISACFGSAAISPAIQQITVSGNNLTNDITAAAPAGFEISLNPNSGYGNSLTLIQTGNSVGNTIVYVRSAATDPSGSISGNVVLSSSGATSQTVAVTGTVNAIPTVTQVSNQIVLNGASTTPVNFSGIANTFNWVNDTPAIGLPANGSGNIPAFTAINTGTIPVTATITVTPLLTGSSGGVSCNGSPITFTILVNPSPPPQVTYTGTLSQLITVYGTPSQSTSFDLSGAGLTSGIQVTPPVGFEVSTDNVNFSSTVTIGVAGAIPSTSVYLRLKSTTPVGSFSGNVILSTPGSANVIITTAISTVTPAPLTIAIGNVNKTYGTTLKGTPGYKGFTSTGLQNGESIGAVTTTYVSGSAANDAVGTYNSSAIITAATGGSFTAGNYTITYLPANIIVDKTPLTIIADNQTKVFGATNPVLTVTYNGFVNNEGPGQLTSQPITTTTAASSSPMGKYPIMVSGATSPDYSIVFLNGVLTITPAYMATTIPNAITPNGDGINDVWDIQFLGDYPHCMVSIFTRYGSLIYQSTGYPKPWDGTYNGKPLPSGTYYYVINLHNGDVPLGGWITIIR